MLFRSLAIGLNFDFFGLYGALDPQLFWGGEQAAWFGPMAVAIIAGILFATFLTLVLVPVLYSLVDDFTAFFRRHYVADDGGEVDESRAGAGTVTSAPGGRGQTQVAPPEPVGVRRNAGPSAGHPLAEGA